MNHLMKKKYSSFIYFIISLIVFFFIIVLSIYNNNKKASKDFYNINFKLITSTHESLPWEFKPVKPLIKIKIGEVVNVEYVVKNISDKKTSGIASFAYYPKELDPYINKIECFCYEVKTLKSGEQARYVLTMMIDPKVTKDIKTKTIKEAIMQFTFFDSKNYKENES
tara:strand:+ start:330 stop:830 length:501 start_codon:yes stop_codon:yes gene_type:complete